MLFECNASMFVTGTSVPARTGAYQWRAGALQQAFQLGSGVRRAPTSNANNQMPRLSSKSDAVFPSAVAALARRPEKEARSAMASDA